MRNDIEFVIINFGIEIASTSNITQTSPMKKAYYIFILFLVSYLNYAQTKHTVIKGETLYSISKKYNITSEDILKANPEVKNGVQENSILTIPKSEKNIISSENVVSHEVEAKET